jgi:hypothetical protein
MKAFIGAVVASIVLAVAAAYVLNDIFQMSAPEAYTTTGARVDRPGSNLIGF